MIPGVKRVEIALVGRDGKPIRFPIEDIDSDWGEIILTEWLRDAFAMGAALEVVVKQREEPNA